MPGATLAMHKIKELVRLKFHAQLSHAQIAAALGISKGVISKYLRLIGAAGLMAAEIERLSEPEIAARLRPARGAADRPSVFVQPDYAGLHTDMKRKGMTLLLGWQEYVAAHAGARTYRYTQFVDRYHQFAKSLKRSMRQVHRAGEKCFIDYAGPTVGYGDGQRAQIFVAVLGASSYTFACATARQTLADWVAGLVRAFEFFGGVTELTVPDNARALIADPDRYEPQASRTLLDVAAHYDTAILPARPYKPQDKAKVEVGVQVVERWILARLRHRQFATLAEVDAAITELLPDLNARSFKKLPGSRLSLYESLDRPALKALPVSRYELAVYRRAIVNIDYHIVFEGHYYSVPQALVRAQVEIRVSAGGVEVLHRGARVAAHRRSYKRGGYTTVAEHLPAAHRAHLEWSPGRLIRWGQTIGPACAALIERLLESRKHPEQGYRACLGILRLARVHGAARLQAACTRALALGNPSYACVASILKNKLESQPITAESEWSAPTHDNVRGSGYYH